MAGVEAMSDEMPKPAVYASAAASIERLRARMDRAGSGLCVGLDPVVEKLPPSLAPLILSSGPAGAIEAFCVGVIDAVRGVAACVKPQLACFERHGSAGYAALERVIARARDAGLWVIFDGKRGDIGLTAGHYAAGAAACGADAVTVNAYMGESAVRPFLEAGLAVFVLVRTSNADSAAVQLVNTGESETVADRMAGLVAGLADHDDRGMSPAGAVVGATNGPELARLRALMPRQVFLMPGVGAQGASAADVRAAVRPGARTAGETGVLVAASRSVLYPMSDRRWETDGWADAVRAAAEDLRDECKQLVPSGESPP